jgi:hypothetical protein
MHVLSINNIIQFKTLVRAFENKSVTIPFENFELIMFKSKLTQTTN